MGGKYMGFNLFKKPTELSKEEIAELLNTSPEALTAFEKTYQTLSIQQDTDNFLDINVHDVKNLNTHFDDISKGYIHDLSIRIVNELLSMSKTMRWKNGMFSVNRTPSSFNNPVTLEEIYTLPENVRPQLTGRYMQRDLKDDGGAALFWTYREFLREKILSGNSSGIICFVKD